MIDTLKMQWAGVSWTAETADWIRSQWPLASQTVQHYDVNFPWEGMKWNDDVLGVMGLRSNKQGNFLWVERSIPKFMYGENCRLLSIEEAHEGAAAWMTGVEQRFKGHWDYADVRAGVKVQRLDLCYQQRVPCSSELFPYIARSVKAKKVVRHQLVLNPESLYSTGVSLPHSKLEHSRWYDKGAESGDERYLNIIRHEEQLRGGKAGYYVDVTGARPTFKVDEARQRMNDRYHGWGTGEVYDLAGLLSEYGTTGAAALALVEKPHLEMLYRQNLPKSTFYRIHKLATEARKQQVPFDLRLPDDAWREPMVL